LNGFVHSASLNHLIQDVEQGWKGPWLCQNCEQLFNRWETWFVNRFVDPFARSRRRFPYDQSLSLFAASLHFRHLHLQITTSQAKARPHDQQLREDLRDMCLAKNPHHPRVFQYIQLLTPVKTVDHFQPGINTYLFESVHPSIQQNVDGIPSSMSFFKLPSALLVTCDFDLNLVMPTPNLLQAHTIQAAGVFNVAAQSGALLNEAAEIVAPVAQQIQDNYSQMSDRQREKIRQRIMNDPDREIRRARRSFDADQYLLIQVRLLRWRCPRLIVGLLATIAHNVGWMPPNR